jgi:hypothetical protein
MPVERHPVDGLLAVSERATEEEEALASQAVALLDQLALKLDDESVDVKLVTGQGHGLSQRRRLGAGGVLSERQRHLGLAAVGVPGKRVHPHVGDDLLGPAPIEPLPEGSDDAVLFRDLPVFLGHALVQDEPGRGERADDQDYQQGAEPRLHLLSVLRLPGVRQQRCGAAGSPSPAL